MKKSNNLIISELSLEILSTTALVLCAVAFNDGHKKETITKGYSINELPTTIDLNDTEESDIRDYYSSLNSLPESERKGTNLLKNLKEILRDGQKYYSYDYNYGATIWQIYEIADRDWVKSPASSTTYGTYDSVNNRLVDYEYGTNSNPKNNPYLHALYINRDVDNQTQAYGDHTQTTGWGINREHIWAKSHGFNATDDSGNSAGARGDPMHLWSASGYINATTINNQYRYHGNLFFGFVDLNQQYYSTDTDGSGFTFLSGNYEGVPLNVGVINNKNVFEPQDSDKGDIARAIFYMVARYNFYSGYDAEGIDSNNPNLELIDAAWNWNYSGSFDSTEYNPGRMGVLRDLLAWNRLDPPDEWEIHRNNLLYNNYTNNRNPFIDYPQWAEFIWGDVTLANDNRTITYYDSTPTYFATPSTDSINSFKQLIHPNAVVIDSAPEIMEIGDTYQLEYTVYPGNATDKRVTFTSSNTDAITVSDTGLLTAIASGSAYIYVTTVDGNITQSVYVSVEGNGPNSKNLPGGTYSVTLSVSGRNNTPPTELGIYSPTDTVYKNLGLNYSGLVNTYNNEYTLDKISNNNGNNTYLETNNRSNATITTVEIDWYSRFDSTIMYKADGITTVSPVSGTNTTNSQSNMQIYTINDSNFKIVNTVNYTRSFYSMKINFEVPTDPSKYSVVFNGNDSSSRPANTPSNVYDLDDGDTASNFGTPTRWGYTFLGWGLTSYATSYVNSVTIHGEDVTLYAIWAEDHTVAGAWEDKPYSVAQARAAIDSGVNLTDVYVTGIISQIDSYNASNKTIIYWISDDGTSTNQFEVYNGGNLNGTNFNAITDIELGATAVIFGTIKKYGSVYEFQAGNYLISYTTPIRSIEFTFTPKTFIKSGEEGAFTYECEVDNVTATYVSSNPSVLEIINATTGAYRAKAAGSALITLTLSKGGDSGSKTVGVNVASISSVSEAYTVASSLSNNETTSEYYYVKGYVIDLNADGYSRSIDVTDGINVIRLFFGASNIDYENIVNSDTNIGSKITVFGRIQNYSGLYELKDLVVDDVESADADSFSAAAYVILNEECEIGPSAVSSGTWSMLAEAYNCLSSTEKEKLTAADVTPYGSNVVKWVNRYTIICNNSSLSNFMTRSDISSRFISDDSSIGTSNTMIIYAVIGLSSLLAISSLILIKRKKHR